MQCNITYQVAWTLYLWSFPIVYSLLRFVKRLTMVRDFCRTMDNWKRTADAKVNLHGDRGFVARIVDTMVWRRILQGDDDDVEDGVINLAMIMMMMIMSFSALGVPANVSQGVLKLLQVWRQPAPAGDIWRLRDSFSMWSGFHCIFSNLCKPRLKSNFYWHIV